MAFQVCSLHFCIPALLVAFQANVSKNFHFTAIILVHIPPMCISIAAELSVFSLSTILCALFYAGWGRF